MAFNVYLRIFIYAPSSLFVVIVPPGGAGCQRKGAALISTVLKLIGGAIGTFDLIGQTAEKLLTGSKEPVDLYGSAQLFDNVARGARETAGETLLGEDDRWKYDLAMTTTDDFIEDKMKGIGTILGTSSSFLGHFKDAKERESSDGEAWNYALTATGLELVGDKADKNTMRPYVRETLEQMGLNRFANLIK